MGTEITVVNECLSFSNFLQLSKYIIMCKQNVGQLEDKTEVTVMLTVFLICSADFFFQVQDKPYGMNNDLAKENM